jgi:hypothetical protein
MYLEGNDPVIGHGGRVSFGRNQGGQPVKQMSRRICGARAGLASVLVDNQGNALGFYTTILGFVTKHHIAM